ncbi:MAG TPA: DUF4203 domain-containing protein [Vicinamibacterales bacterium]|jgi:hypothetical protein
MLPHSYELPAAVLLVLGGTLSCFAGYRLFKITLAIYGFILGAMLASSSMGISNTAGMVAAAVLGGLAGALIMVFAYFIGIGLAGAALGALIVAPVAWGFVRTGDPPTWLIITLAILGSLGATVLQRYVVVIATACFGAWMMIVGAIALTDGGVGRTSRLGDVWILYPTTPHPGRAWVPIAWIALGVLGTVVQLGMTSRKKR